MFTLTYVFVIVLYYFIITDPFAELDDMSRFVSRIKDPFSSAMVLVILMIGQPVFQSLYFAIHKLNCFVYIKYYGY